MEIRYLTTKWFTPESPSGKQSVARKVLVIHEQALRYQYLPPFDAKISTIICTRP